MDERTRDETDRTLRPFAILLGCRLRGHVRVDARHLDVYQTPALYAWINETVWPRCAFPYGSVVVEIVRH